MRKSYWRPPIIERNRWEREKDARDDTEAAHAQAGNRESSLTEMLAKNRCIAVAFHEAGHAVVAAALGQPVNEVAIAEDGSGHTWHVRPVKRDFTGECAKKALEGIPKTGKARAVFFDHVVVLLGGLAVQKKLTDRFEYRQANCAGDYRDIAAIVYATTNTEDEADHMLTNAYHKAEELVAKHWAAIVELGGELYVQRRLGPAGIETILLKHGLSAAPRQPAVKPKPKLREHIYRDDEAPIIADLQRMDGWIGG